MEKDCFRCRGTGVEISASQPVLTADLCSACDPPTWDQKCSLQSLAERYNAANIPSQFITAYQSPSPLGPDLEEWLASLPPNNTSWFFNGLPEARNGHLAVALLLMAIVRGHTGFYVDAAAYVRDTRKCHNSRYVDGIGDRLVARIDEIQRRVRHFDLVVMDNLGDGRNVTDFTIDTYSELVDLRNSTGKPTIYLSRHGPSRAESFEGKSLADKIGEVAARMVNSCRHLEQVEQSISVKQTEAVDFTVVDQRAAQLADDQSTFLHIWSRLGLFRLLSTRDRARLTRMSEIDDSETIEVPEAREYVSVWGKYHVMQTGAVADYYDCNVLVALLKLYHRRGKKGVIAFSLAQLAEELGIKSKRAGPVQRALKRSLYRLLESKVRIIGPQQRKPVWVGGFIDSLIRESDSPQARTVVRLNEFIVGHFNDNLYTSLDVPILTGLSSQYAQGIYRFLVGQRDDYKFIGIEKWRCILGVKDEACNRVVRRGIQDGMKELIERSLLTQASHIDAAGIVHTYLVRTPSENRSD